MINRWLGIAVICVAACNDPFEAGSARAYKSITTGGDHTCAVSEGGEAYCWGSGVDGQLGTGTKDVRITPAQVLGGLVFEQITAGQAHTCALTPDGTAYCWGWNAFYQRGNPTDGRDSEPVPVTSNVRFRSISAGAHHTCALSLDSLAYCWGYNRFGQAGNGTTNTTIQPIAVVGGHTFAQLSSGAWHTCAVTPNGSGLCWGRNDFGQLGIGSNEINVEAPAAINTGARFRMIDAGATHTCGVARDDTFYCWGSNEHGELGVGGAFKPGLPGANAPVPVSSQFPAGQAIFAGTSHTCAIGSNRLARCWGRGEFGQLGNGMLIDQFQPQPIDLLAFDIPVGVFGLGGFTHACALVDKSAFCWGTGYWGQLGVAQSRLALLPQRVGD